MAYRIDVGNGTVAQGFALANARCRLDAELELHQQHEWAGWQVPGIHLVSSAREWNSRPSSLRLFSLLTSLLTSVFTSPTAAVLERSVLRLFRLCEKRFVHMLLRNLPGYSIHALTSNTRWLVENVWTSSDPLSRLILPFSSPSNASHS